MESIAAGRSKARFKPKAARDGWIALDNAANIFPSTISKVQRHLYHFVFTLYDSVDPNVLKRALKAVMPRFPSIVAGLRAGAFWYALEPAHRAPQVTPAPEHRMPPMTMSELRQCCLRVHYDGRRIIVEFFHALCDGSAALIFVKTLTAVYLSIRYGVEIPCANGVLNVKDRPAAAELADSYARYTGSHSLKRDMSRSFRLTGTLPDAQALTVTDLVYDETAVCLAAKQRGVSVTAFTTAVMAQTMLRIQSEEHSGKLLPVRIAVPVNLRQFFPTQTLRNFSLSMTVEIDPNMGDWSLAELCTSVYHQMKQHITRTEMTAGISTNVALAKHPLFKYLPLFVKSPLMRIGYGICAKRTCCISVSNLGRIALPKPMECYVQNVFCTPDANPQSPCSCAVLSYGGLTHVGLCRCMKADKVVTVFEAAMREALS